jgi:hypothetical protein
MVGGEGAGGDVGGGGGRGGIDGCEGKVAAEFKARKSTPALGRRHLVLQLMVRQRQQIGKGNGAFWLGQRGRRWR